MGASKRQSLGGAKVGRSSAGGNDVMMGAKKRVRQSEYARRRSRAATASADSPSGRRPMDIDDE
jgi:hypothetical protein